MEFRIADTFTDSLSRLSNEEQKLVKTTAFDLQMDPASPGMQFHKLDRAKDKNFWSVRVGRDIRLIVHRTAGNLLLCYAGHHNDAYGWAERRKIETHPKTGAAQLVEVRERVQEIVVPKYVEVAKQATAPKLLFAKITDDDLLSFGVPLEWLGDVRKATEDTLFGVADHLPHEAAEALLELAVGGKPRAAEPAPPAKSPFEHPDARQRFRLMTNVEELERALAAPWEKWAVFLHPAQQDLIERRFNGPARAAGSAGTGKTVVALHRAVFLAHANPDAKVLVTTFSDILASMLRAKLRVLVANDAAVQGRVIVLGINTLGVKLYTEAFGAPNIADAATLAGIIRKARSGAGEHQFSEQFLRSEWDEVVDAWQLKSWDDYRTVGRLGRKTRLGEAQRKVLWQVFERVRRLLDERKLVTMAAVFARITECLGKGGTLPFDHAVIDEAQDINVAQLRFLAALAGTKANGLFFTGDLGQRIFQAPFSWKSLGIDVRGRSKTLTINYRTSHQIRRQADRLLPSAVSDVDGIAEERDRTISVFNGPEPLLTIVKDRRAESEKVSNWLAERQREGLQPYEIGVFVRSEAQLERARQAVLAAGLEPAQLDDAVETPLTNVLMGTMHSAKGMEFKAVVVMACDDDIVPLQERVEMVTDHADLQEVYDTERHLLYVACTRARDHLLVTGVSPGSEFLEDMRR